jgi:uncharacterized membrane protein YozB (DUF420 family)
VRIPAVIRALVTGGWVARPPTGDVHSDYVYSALLWANIIFLLYLNTVSVQYEILCFPSLSRVFVNYITSLFLLTLLASASSSHG